MSDDIKDVQSGEELDLSKLAPFLQEQIEGFGATISVKQFGAGHSNLTYLLRDEDNGREVVLRRPPHGAQIKSGHDMQREYEVLTALAPHWSKAPKPLAINKDGAILGAPFYVMERVEGVILRGPKPRNVELPEQTMSRVCEALLDTFIEIHSLDLDEIGLAEFGRPEGYIARQISGWTRRWKAAKTDDIAQIDDAVTWLNEHMPREPKGALIHNDFKYDNLILDPQELGSVRAVLDWEMATLGDPMMDLGTSLAYWVEPGDSPVLQQLRFGPTTLPGNYTRQQLVDRYGELTGRDTSEALFYYVYGLFKVAVVGQQIYARYKKGHTKDERFAGLIFAVQALGQAAADAIAAQSISAT
jgi:aminoglycoside phosphotransferase (APT) family kinase protein